MARPLRVEFEGAAYHVTARGNERKKIFNSSRDYDKFLEYVSDAREKYRFHLHRKEAGRCRDKWLEGEIIHITSDKEHIDEIPATLSIPDSPAGAGTHLCR